MQQFTRSFILITLILTSVFSQAQTERQFTLDDFYDYNPILERKVDEVFNKMNDTLRVGQLIVPAVGEHGKKTPHVVALAAKGYIGGVLLLNGTVDSFTDFVNQFDSIADTNGYLRPIYSADAEPTLIKYKIKGTTPVPKTNMIKSKEEVVSVTKTISADLNKIGITQNFAPVIDASPNKTVSNRSFGLNMDTVISFSNLFIDETQKNGIVATAKHFPGHGFVVGDTHKNLVNIDGEMKEVDNYKPVIKNGVLFDFGWAHSGKKQY